MDYKDFNDYELINYIAEGNEEASNIIIKKYEPLILNIAGKMLPLCKNNGLDINDLVQEGMIGLNHAIDRYQEQENTLFYTYAKKCIERKIISTVVSSKRGKDRALNESVSYDDDENDLMRVLKDSSPNPEEVLMSSEYEENLIIKVKNILTPFESQVFELLISGFKYTEIADLLDVDKKSIDNAIQRIKGKIKKEGLLEM